MRRTYRSLSQASWLLVCVLAALLCVTGKLAAQQPTGTILGVVKDSTGGVIPAASVTVTNTDTGMVRTGSTGATGAYRFSALPVGTYEIRVEHTGFQREVRSGLKLNVGQEAVLNFALQVGAVEQTVAVTAEAPMIETTSATVSGLVGESTMRDLPLNARSLIELGSLFAGMTVARSAGTGTPAGYATKLSILGTTYTANLFQLDGMEIKDLTGTAGSAAGVLMGVETVREFNIVASGYSAEYGNHSGGVFNAVTKSGTNNFHGSVFEFLRNDKMDARNFFDRDTKNPAVRSDPPPYKRNQFGFSLGGPIARDQTFFFGSYEALRERLGRTQTLTVPTAGLRRGLLPNLRTGEIDNIGVDPRIQPWLDLYPSPTPGGRDFGDGTTEFIRPVSIPTSENFFSIRVDQRISEKDSLFGRYTRDKAFREGSPGLHGVTTNRTNTQYLTVSGTRLMTPQVINVLLLGFNRSVIGSQGERIPGTPKLPISSFNYNTSDKCDPAGGASGGGLSSNGGGCGDPLRAKLLTYQLKNDVFYTTGAHSFKFGFNAQRMDQQRLRNWGFGGQFSFRTLEDLLRARPENFSAELTGSDPVVNMRQYLYGLYAQDDIRLSPSFTLNLGLRYEFITVPHVRRGRTSNIHNYLAKGGQTRADFVLGNPMWLNPSLKNWAPRAGFAWDVTGGGKTSLRGGAGLFYNQVFAGPWAFAFVSTPPFLERGDLVESVAGVPVDFPNAFWTQSQLLTGSPQIEGIQYKLDQPTVFKSSLDVQQSITSSTSVDVGVSATNGWHLPRVISINSPVGFETVGPDGQTPRFFIPQGSPLLHPNLGRVRPRQTDSRSSYYALRLQLNQRYARNLQYRVGYTFSKAIDTHQGNVGSGDWDSEGSTSIYKAMLNEDKGRAAFDLHHVLTSNFTYDLPWRDLTGVAGKVLGGWQVSGIVSLQTGIPFNVSAGANPRWWRFITHRPDVVAGAKVRYDTRNPERYFDPSAFTMPGMTEHPAPGTAAAANPGWLGNAGRNILTGPGLATLNLTLAKSTRLYENVRLQVRSEFFNLFNRANFDPPSSTIFDTRTRVVSPTVGRITSTETTSRQVQLALKLEF